MARSLAAVAAASAVALAFASDVGAASGDLDGGFATCGIVITDVGPGGELNALALQADGKIVGVGEHDVGPIAHGSPTTTDLVVVRYDADGTLDADFAGDGIVTLGRAPGTFEDGRAVVVQPDGKIVVGGATTLVRLHADGTLDAGFGTGGIVSDVRSNALVLQPDGKLVTAGSTGGDDNDFAIARYDDQGNLDATFGAGGVVTTSIGGNDRAFALVLQPDGKLVAAGDTVDVGVHDAVLVRYEDDGDLDGTFGSGGIVVDPITALNDEINALVLQPDDKLVAGGSAFDLLVARYRPAGGRDDDFGTDGVVITEGGEYGGGVRALALQSGAIVAAGSNGNQVMLVAHEADGALDAGFGSGGIVTTQVANGAYTNALVVQSDGKLVVGGGTFNGKAFVARYFGTEGTIGDPPPFCPTPTATPVVTPSPTATPTPIPVCAPLPAPDCRKPTRPAKSKVQLKSGTPDTKDLLLWHWGSGTATTKAEFGDPTTTTDYALCVYDRSGGVPVRVLSASIPSNTTELCDGTACWKASARGYKYGDRLASHGGIRSVLLREGAHGSARISVKGKGVDLDMPGLPLGQEPTVTVQLVQDGGLCWDADYSTPATKNLASDFKDSSD